jgi:hypothetical protein
MGYHSGSLSLEKDQGNGRRGSRSGWRRGIRIKTLFAFVSVGLLLYHFDAFHLILDCIISKKLHISTGLSYPMDIAEFPVVVDMYR